MLEDIRKDSAVGPLVAMLVALGMVILCAQPTSGGTIPRMPDGRPDLQGMYDIATVTPLERPAGQPLELSDEQARRAERQVLDLVALANRPSNPERTAPPVGGDGSTGNSGGVGGYNVYWIGGLPSRVTVVDGQPRGSLIIDPADGRLPALVPPRVVPVSAPPVAGIAPGDADGPESRSLAERCLLMGSNAGSPMLPYLYNNLHQIVQTADRVVIVSEMIHDARIIRIGGQHLPTSIRTWLGDSIGRWEGDSLVVDTTNFRADNGFLGATDALHVVERISRIDERTLRYRFTADDPGRWTRPWTGEFVWPATAERSFEYACHEGNHALVNILSGARSRD